MHPEDWDQDVRDFLLEGAGRRPFDFSQLHYIRDVNESKRLNFLTVPAIIISASGMCEHGRILHHLRNNISDPNDAILFAGYQAENTLGRKIVEGVSPVNIFGEPFTVRAQVVKIDGYSAHADQSELLAWTQTINTASLQRTFVVHGELRAATVMADKLRACGMAQVEVPRLGESFDL